LAGKSEISIPLSLCSLSLSLPRDNRPDEKPDAKTQTVSDDGRHARKQQAHAPPEAKAMTRLRHIREKGDQARGSLVKRRGSGGRQPRLA